MNIDIKKLRELHEQDGLVWTEDKGCVSAWSGEPDSDDCDGFNFYMGSRAAIAVAARNALQELLDVYEERAVLLAAAKAVVENAEPKGEWMAKVVVPEDLMEALRALVARLEGK